MGFRPNKNPFSREEYGGTVLPPSRYRAIASIARLLPKAYCTWTSRGPDSEGMALGETKCLESVRKTCARLLE